MTTTSQEIKRMEHMVPSIHELVERPRSVFVCLLATLICLAVQLNAIAQQPGTEMNLEIAQATTTVKCDTGEHYFAIVRASMPDAGTLASAGAFGFALVSAKSEVWMYAHYWFLFPGNAPVMRDDDTGKLEQGLIQIKSG